MTSPIVVGRKSTQLARRLLVPRRRECAAKARERQTVCANGDAIRDVVQVSQRTRAGRLRRHEVEVFVVAFDPVQRRPGSGIRAVLVSKVARAHPELDIGMTRHHPIERVEIAVQITDSAKEHLEPGTLYRCAGVGAPGGTGTSRSFLSQMNSLLLYTASS